MLALRKGSHRDLGKFYPLIEADFDSRELLPRLAIHKGLLKGEMELLIAYDDESEIMLGYALAMTKNVYKYVLLKYVAVLPWYRDKGVGIELMRLINKEYSQSQGLIAEIPVFENNDAEQIRKLTGFFKRFGYEEIKSSYKIGGAETKVFVKPMKSSADISPVYHRIMRDFYSRCLQAGTKMVEINKI